MRSSLSRKTAREICYHLNDVLEIGKEYDYELFKEIVRICIDTNDLDTKQKQPSVVMTLLKKAGCIEPIETTSNIKGKEYIIRFRFIQPYYEKQAVYEWDEGDYTSIRRIK